MWVPYLLSWESSHAQAAARSAVAWCGPLPTLASAVTCLDWQFPMSLQSTLKQAVAEFPLTWIPARPVLVLPQVSG